MTEVFSNQIGVSSEALAKAEARAADLAIQLGFTAEAVIGFFRTIGEQEVPLDKVPAKLAEIAAHYRGGPRETKPSVAVLPFQNMSGDPSQEYFADGMVDEITTALSRVRWIHVVSRNSSFTYKGQAIDTRQVGRELDVGYVLEGSVRKSGNRVRITARLIEAETNANLTRKGGGIWSRPDAVRKSSAQLHMGAGRFDAWTVAGLRVRRPFASG